MIKYNLIIDFFVERIYNLYGEIYYDFIKSKYRNFHMHWNIKYCFYRIDRIGARQMIAFIANGEW